MDKAPPLYKVFQSLEAPEKLSDRAMQLKGWLKVLCYLYFMKVDPNLCQ